MFSSSLTIILECLYILAGFILVYASPALEPEARNSAPILSAKWISVGCYSDSTIAGMRHIATFTELYNMTIDLCLAFCTPADYRYAGVTFSQECYCGNVIGPPELIVNATSCNTPCTGDAAELCGGLSAVNIFRNLEKPQSPLLLAVEETVGSLQYKDCFEGAISKALYFLPNQITMSGGATAETCTTACPDARLAFEWECWCASYMALSTPALHPVCNSVDIMVESLSTPVATTSRSSTAGSGFWNYRNSLFGSTFVQTGIPPALVNHNGQLFVLYTDRSSNNLYYATGNNDNWGGITRFIDATGQSYPVSNTQAPALISLDGDLHAVIQQNGNIIHFIFNDAAQVWQRESVITSSFEYPALTAYNGQLFLAMASNNGHALSFSSWNPETGWSSIGSANGETTWGIPAMYVQGGELYMIFAANNDDRGLINLIYNATTVSWSRVPPPGSESTAFGVSATFGDGLSFMGFQDHRGTGAIFVSVNNGSWAPHETPGGSSSDTPTLAVLDGVLNVVVDSNNGNRDILWLQRPLTNYSLESWMSVLSNSKSISSLSIPGTHDSVAVSVVPTVGCQTMSITEQLNSGIRYFDLRCGLVANVVFMFHGTYPINPPTFLQLTTVIATIQQWLSVHPTEAVIVQIKEDSDPSASNVAFANAVSQVIRRTTSSWNLGTTLPSLGDLRGKMQLMRRYPVNQTAGEQAIGIDLTSWQYNNPRFDIYTPSGVHLVVQDEHQFDENLEALVPDKFAVVNNLLKEATNNSDTTAWYLNFASATHVFDAGSFWIMPEDIAVGAWDLQVFTFVPGVNSHLRDEIYGLPSGERYGTLLMDFPESPDDDLVTRIVASNM